MHRLEVALHAVHSDCEDVDETQVLGVLGEHGLEHAWDNVAKMERFATARGVSHIKLANVWPVRRA